MALFEKYDEDESGLLDNEELLVLLEEEFEYQPGDRLIDDTIESFDEDGDGSIDKTEFKELWGAITAAAAAGKEAASRWYEKSRQNGGQTQCSLQEAAKLLTDGALTEESDVWLGGMEEWSTLAEARNAAARAA